MTAVAICNLNGGWRTVGNVAIGKAITVVHGTHEFPGAPLLAFSLARWWRRHTVARLRGWGCALLEELLLLSPLSLCLVGSRMRALAWGLLRVLTRTLL